MTENQSIDSGKITELSEIFKNHSDEVIELYKQHVPQYLSDLKEAALCNDLALLSHQSHKMGSAMKTIGYTKIADLLHRIEKNEFKDRGLEEVIGEIEALTTESIQYLELLTEH